MKNIQSSTLTRLSIKGIRVVGHNLVTPIDYRFSSIFDDKIQTINMILVCNSSKIFY